MGLQLLSEFLLLLSFLWTACVVCLFLSSPLKGSNTLTDGKRFRLELSKMDAWNLSNAATQLLCEVSLLHPTTCSITDTTHFAYREKNSTIPLKYFFLFKRGIVTVLGAGTLDKIGPWNLKATQLTVFITVWLDLKLHFYPLRGKKKIKLYFCLQEGTSEVISAVHSRGKMSAVPTTFGPLPAAL